MSVVVVGTVALDSIYTPFGSVEEELGGSACYFSLAARLYDDVTLLAVVGSDFPDRHVECLRTRGVNLAGLQLAEGPTFRWKGSYLDDLNTAVTLDTQLNVLTQFRPHVPREFCRPDVLFLANVDPDLQLQALSQVSGACLKVADTMNYWIESKPSSLTKVFSAVDIVVINEAEAKQFTGIGNLPAAAKALLGLGMKALAIKRGEYGCALFTQTDYFVAPAYPLERVLDPTGAGDTFAGGFVGYLSRVRQLTPDSLRRAVLHGSAVASFAVEDFGVRRLLRLSVEEVVSRCRELRHFTYLEAL